MHIRVHTGKEPNTVYCNGQPIAVATTPANAKLLAQSVRLHFDFLDVSEDIIENLNKWVALYKERADTDFYNDGVKAQLTEVECAQLFGRLVNVVYNLNRLVSKDREQRLARAMDVKVEE